VKDPAHLLPTLGSLAISARHVYLLVRIASVRSVWQKSATETKRTLTAATAGKVGAMFLGSFALGFLLSPDLTMQTFFQDGSFKLDSLHYWLMCGFGVLALWISAICWKLSQSDEYEKFLPIMTVFSILLTCAQPLQARASLPVKDPAHLLPTLGSLAISALHVYLLVKGTKAKVG